MAKTPATANGSMNMKAHEETFYGFLNMIKISVVALVITMVALYCFAIAGQPWIGAFLLIILMPASIVWNVVSGWRN